MAATTWRDVSTEILARIDVQAEYERWGIKIAGAPSASGWVSCHAFDRDDFHASAQIHVGDGPSRGRYRDFGGEQSSLSFFDAAAELDGRFERDWRQARKHYSEAAGVKVPDRFAEKKLAFRKVTPGTLLIWCEKKPRVKPEACMAAGVKAAGYPARMHVTKQQSLLAFPMYASGHVHDEPCGWHCVRSDGKKIELFQGKGKPTEHVRMMTLGKPGVMNVWGLSKLEGAEVVWITEGLSDMLALQSLLGTDQLKEVVLTAGASSYQPAREALEKLKGKEVRLVFDVDEAGRNAAARWARDLAPLAKVGNIQLPLSGEKDDKDLRNWLEEGGSLEALRRLAVGTDLAEVVVAEDGQATDTADGEEVKEVWDLDLEAVGLQVLGEFNRRGDVMVYSQNLHKISAVQVKPLDEMRLKQLIGGPAFRDCMSPGMDRQGNKPTVRDIKSAIAIAGATLWYEEGNIRGAGAWPSDDGEGLLLIGHRVCHRWREGGKLERWSGASSGGFTINANGRSWYQEEHLQNLLDHCRDVKWRMDAMDEIFEIFHRFDNWKNPVSSHVLTGLLFATYVQAVWPFRPQVFISGLKNTGKTTLFGDLTALFHFMTDFSFSKPSEASIREHGTMACAPILIDEFEAGSQVTKILELLRTSTRPGTVVTRASNRSGQGIIRFALNHIAWTAAVSPGFREATDISRFLQFDLELPARGKTTLPLLPREKLLPLGQKATAIAIHAVMEAVRLYHGLMAESWDWNARMVSLYAVPACMLSAIQGTGLAGALELTRAWLTAHGDREREESGWEKLLEDILGAECVTSDNGNRYPVADLLVSDPESLRDGNKTHTESVSGLLERHGISVRKKEEGVLLLNAGKVKQTLLRNHEDWRGKRIGEMLNKIPGAIVGERYRIGAQDRVRCVAIPWPNDMLDQSSTTDDF